MTGFVTDAKRTVLDWLKRNGPAKAADIAEAIELTDVAVRQHLHALKDDGLVSEELLPARGRGRPSTAWSVTHTAGKFFPDRHGELTASLIAAVRETLGETALDKVIAARGEKQVAYYRGQIAQSGRSLKAKVSALAVCRTEEGYMAEVKTERPGVYLLIEHHCAICEAASNCLGLCRSELEVFQRSLGEEIQVERTEHLLSEGNRCVYRISVADK